MAQCWRLLNHHHRTNIYIYILQIVWLQQIKYCSKLSGPSLGIPVGGAPDLSSDPYKCCNMFCARSVQCMFICPGWYQKCYPLVIQHSYWKWPSMVSFSPLNMVIFHRHVSLPEDKRPFFHWFSHGFPMVFLWFPYGFYTRLCRLQLPATPCRAVNVRLSV